MKLIVFYLVNAVESSNKRVKRLNLALYNKSKKENENQGFSIDEIILLDSMNKIQNELCDLFDKYEDRKKFFNVQKANAILNENKSLTSINPVENYIHPEIFFSLKELENFNVIKLFGRGNYGKVKKKIFMLIFVFLSKCLKFNKKVFLVSLKSSNQKVFAMKVLSTGWKKGLSIPVTEHRLTLKEVGRLGSQCIFLVETICTFKSKVYYFKDKI